MYKRQPEDRMQDGIAATASIQDNAISTYYRKPEYSGKVFMKGKSIRKIAQELIHKFQVKTNSEKQRINSLSGGNIQKVVVAREWQTSPKCMIASQPTRGIDIGSANYIPVSYTHLDVYKRQVHNTTNHFCKISFITHPILYRFFADCTIITTL